MRLVLLMVLVSSVPALALAQATPDVVRTRDGAMVRGTIVERVPGSHVLLQTAQGEFRRIEESELVAAGPVATQAGPTGVPLRLVADEPLGFHLVTGTATATAWGPGGLARARGYDFRALCRAPCETRLPTGHQRLALSVGDNTPIPASSLDITGPGTLFGEYTDRSGARVAGWTTLVIGVAAGLSLMLVPVFEQSLLDSDALYAFLGIGGAVAIVAAVVGAPLGFMEDGATVRFE